MILTVGMPTFEDYCGVWETVVGMRLANRGRMDGVEILIVDNKPDGPEGQMLASTHRAWWAGPQEDGCTIRYIPMPYPVGAANAKQRVFEEARGEIVVCMDSHVMLGPEWFLDVLRFFGREGHERDMLTGPILYDNLSTISTHFADRWRGRMWGTWDTDPRGKDPHGEPFEIPANGCGFFAMRKNAWPGFNAKFRGFGGEEWYIHEKVRRAGGKVMCHPALRWAHRFGRPGGNKFPLSDWNKVRNYVIGHAELGLPLDRVHRQFFLGIDEAGQGEPEVRHQPVVPPHEWAILTANPSSPPEVPPGQPAAAHKGAGGMGGGCGGCGAEEAAQLTLEQLYERAWKTPSDINEHCPTLRQLARQCATVVEFGCRHGVSTVALLAGQPLTFITHGISPPDPMVKALIERRGRTDFVYRQEDSRTADRHEADCLFIDTTHTASHLWAELDRHAGHVRRWIVLHDTVVYGEVGEDGGPGLLPAVRRFCKERPEWTVIRADTNNHGLMVLSRDYRDKTQPPGVLRKALNFTLAGARNFLAGSPSVPEAVFNSRVETCLMCPKRHHDTCSLCGCPVQKKCAMATEACPDNPPRWKAMA